MFVILIRHGETDYNKEGIVQGNEVDPPLNECGERQAIETGNLLKINLILMLFIHLL